MFLLHSLNLSFNTFRILLLQVFNREIQITCWISLFRYYSILLLLLILLDTHIENIFLTIQLSVIITPALSSCRLPHSFRIIAILLPKQKPHTLTTQNHSIKLQAKEKNFFLLLFFPGNFFFRFLLFVPSFFLSLSLFVGHLNVN